MVVGVVCAGGWPASWGTCCAGGVAPTVTPPVGIVAPTPVTIIRFIFRITESGRLSNQIILVDAKNHCVLKSITSLIIQQSVVLDAFSSPCTFADARSNCSDHGTNVRSMITYEGNVMKKRAVSSLGLATNTAEVRPLTTNVWARLARRASVFCRAVGAWHPMECSVVELVLSEEGIFSGERTISGETQRVTL